MLILGLLGMYFDAAVVFVTKSLLFFRLALAILWNTSPNLINEINLRKKPDSEFAEFCTRALQI